MIINIKIHQEEIEMKRLKSLVVIRLAIATFGLVGCSSR